MDNQHLYNLFSYAYLFLFPTLKKELETYGTLEDCPSFKDFKFYIIAMADELGVN